MPFNHPAFDGLEQAFRLENYQPGEPLDKKQDPGRWKQQAVFVGPDSDRGDCVQACVASFLNIPMEEVPEFHKIPEVYDFWEAVDDFIESKGWIKTPSAKGRDHAGFYFVSGPTVRGTSHMVIYKRGELFHDPHPSNAGVTTVEHTHYLNIIDKANAPY